jgi:hypothetical protein
MVFVGAGLAKKFVFPQIRLGFCRRYKLQPKSQKRSHWGSKLLPVVSQPKGKKSAGQMTLPWAFWDSPPEEISLVAEKFVIANGYPTVPDIGKALFFPGKGGI